MAEQFATLSSVTTMLLEILSLSSFGVYISMLPNHKQMDLFKKVIYTNLLFFFSNKFLPPNYSSKQKLKMWVNPSVVHCQSWPKIKINNLAAVINFAVIFNEGIKLNKWLHSSLLYTPMLYFRKDMEFQECMRKVKTSSLFPHTVFL